MTKKAPPANPVQKTSRLYAGALGQLKTCATCGEAKEITRRTFAPKKASPDGVAATCRQCQGSSARQKGLTARAAGVLPNPPSKPSGWPSPTKDRRAYWQKVKETTDRLYELGGRPGKRNELEAIIADLRKVTLVHGDPAGGGEQIDAEAAFRAFIHVLSQLISDWVPFGEVHDDLIAALVGDESEEDQVLMLASRGSGKSTLVEIYCAWLLFRNPLDVVGVVSGAGKRAKRALRTVRLFIEQCPLLHHLRPNEECLDASDQFVTPQAHGKLGSKVSFSSFGIQSTITGHRWNKVILDDIETTKDRTPLAQQNLDLLADEIGNVLGPKGRAICLGTPQVEGMSIYARWAESGEWSVTRALLFEELSPDEGRGKRTRLRSRWPARFTDADLETKRRRTSLRNWALHWCIDLTALQGDRRPIKLREFITYDWPAEATKFPAMISHGGERLSHLEKGASADAEDFFQGPYKVATQESRYVATIAAVDPASGMVGRDEVGVAVVSITPSGHGVIRSVRGVRGASAHETLSAVASLLVEFLPTGIVCEARADSLYPNQLEAVLGKRGYGAKVEAVQSGTKKGERITDTITTLLADHRLVLLEDVIKGPDALESVHQLVSVTADGRDLKHDDRVDALAWGLHAAGPLLLVDPADNFETEASRTVATLMALPIRKGGIKDDGIEAMLLEASEEEERAAMRLAHCLETQERELRSGKVDHRYAAYIHALQNDLANLRRGRHRVTRRLGQGVQ